MSKKAFWKILYFLYERIFKLAFKSFGLGIILTGSLIMGLSCSHIEKVLTHKN